MLLDSVSAWSISPRDSGIAMAEKPILTGAFRRLLDEVERRLAVVIGGIAGGAELQRIGRRVDALRANAAGEQQRHAGVLGFLHDRRIGRRQAGIDDQNGLVLGDQLLGIGGGLRGLRAIVFENERDLVAVHPALGVDAVDIDA